MEDSAHPGGILGPHAAALRVRDQERSRRFFVERLVFEAIVDMPTPEGSRWIVVAPTAAGWLSGTAGAGLTGMALVVPPEGSAEHQRIGQNTGFSFLTEDVHRVFQNGRDAACDFRSPQ